MYYLKLEIFFLGLTPYFDQYSFPVSFRKKFEK